MAIFTAIAGAVAAVGAWFGGLSIVAQIGVRFAAGLALNALSRALAGKPEGPREPGIVGEIQQGADIGRSFLMGVRATAGSLVYHNQWGGSENELYTRITALSDLPIDGLIEVWVDGKLYQLDRDNPHEDYGWPIIGLSEERTKTEREQIGTTTDGRDPGPVYKVTETSYQEPYGWVKFYDGNQTAADSFVVDKVATAERPWSAADVGVGVAYAVTTFKINRTLFQGLPQVLFVCRGIRMLDRSTGETGHSQNTIVQADALLSGISFGGEWFYGPQSGARLDATEVTAEILKCKEPVPGASEMSNAERIAAFGSTSIPRRYRSSLEVFVDRPVADVLEDIISACNGRISEVGTRYRIQVGDPAPAVASLTDADFRSTQGQSFAPFFPLAETVNAVTATYPAPAEGWQAQDAPPLYRPDLEAEDGNRRLPTGVQLDAVPFPEQVQRLMASALAEARRARRHSATLPARFWHLEPGDFVEWTSARHGYANKLWRIDGLRDLQNGDIAVDLTEVDPDDYDRDASVEFRPVVPGSLSGVVRPPVVLEGWDVEGVSVGDGTSLRPALQFNWTPPADDVFTGLSYQIRLTADQRIISSGVIAEVGQGFDVVSGALLAATGYEARARLVTTRRSEWTAWLGAVTPDVRLVFEDFDPIVTQTIADTVDAVEAVGQAVGVVEQFALQTQERIEADARARVPADRIIDDSLEQISARITDLLMRVSDTRNTIARAGVYVDEVDGSVKIEGVKTLEGALFEAQIAINEIAGQISLTATQQFVREEVASAVLDPSQIPLLSDIVAQLNSVQLLIDAATASILAKADVLTVNELSTRQTLAELDIDGLEADIALRALATDVDEVETRVTNAELELSTLDGAAFNVALQDVRRLSGENEASAVADLAGLLRSYEEGEQRRADLASARLSLSADIDEGRTALAQLEVELAAAIDASEALVLQESEARADALSAEAIARQDVTARVGDLEADVTLTSAAVTDLATATSDADSALAQRATNLEARATDLEGKVGATSAVLSDLATASANADSALAQRATNLEARATDLESDVSATTAAVSDLATASVDADTALAQRATSLEARAGDLEDDVSATSAAVSDLATASANADSALAQRATNLEARASDLEGEVAATSAAVSTLATASANADSALAQRATNLEARATDLEGDVAATSAAVSDLATASANADTALAQRATSLEASVNSPTTGLSKTRADLSSLSTASASADSALAQRATNLEARADDLEGDVTATSAALSNLSTASANGDSALAQRAASLEASVNSPTTGLAKTRADLSSLSTASASADTALAQRASTLEATVNNGSTGLAAVRGRVQTLEDTRVTSAGAVSAVTQTISASYGSMEALATAAAFAKSGVDGLLSGFRWRTRSGGIEGEVELVSNGIASLFKVSADRIQFVSPFTEYFGDVEITGDLFVNGTLTAEKFTTDATGKISNTKRATNTGGLGTSYSTVLTHVANHDNRTIDKNMILSCRMILQATSDAAGNVMEYRILRNGVLMSGVPPLKRDVRPGEVAQEFFGIKQRTTADVTSTTYTLEARVATNGSGIASVTVNAGTEMWTEEKSIAGIV